MAAYSLYIGQAHTDFAEAKLQKRLVERQLENNEVDQLAIISMAGVASEAQKYEEVSFVTIILPPLGIVILMHFRYSFIVIDVQQTW